MHSKIIPYTLGLGLRGDISPLTPERDNKPAEQYSISAYGHPFANAGQLPCRGPSGFMPPPPVDQTGSMQGNRSNTPQMQGIYTLTSLRNQN